jgi:hypothetical protein
MYALHVFIVFLAPTSFYVDILVFHSVLKMEATCSSETSIELQRTARHYIPEDGTPACESAAEPSACVRSVR